MPVGRPHLQVSGASDYVNLTDLLTVPTIEQRSLTDPQPATLVVRLRSRGNEDCVGFPVEGAEVVILMTRSNGLFITK